VHLRRVAVPSALILALVLVPAAEAKLPNPKVTTIVPGKSVAGVKLGMRLAVAKQTWGPGSKCGAGAAGPGSTSCTWSATPNAQPDRGPKLILLSIGGKVRAITVDGGTGGTAIKTFRTAKGIGVGSTLAALRAAYAGLGTSLGPDNPSLGSGPTITSFYVKGGRVKSIQVGSPY
jgi:hypothetical protein